MLRFGVVGSDWGGGAGGSWQVQKLPVKYFHVFLQLLIKLMSTALTMVPYIRYP